MRRNVNRLASLLATAVAISIGSELRADLIVHDSFTGAAGTVISTRNPDTVNGGTATWKVNSNAALTGNGAVSVPESRNHEDVASQASILLPGVASQYNGKGSVLSIKIKATVSTPGSWVSIGFSKDDNPWSWGMNQSDAIMLLNARLAADGSYQIYVGNTAYNSGQIAGFNANVAHTMVLTRDDWWNVNLYVDDVKVVSSYLAEKGQLEKPSLANNWGQVSPGVGFRINPAGANGVGNDAIDYFAAGTGDYAVPVPEVASLGLLSLPMAGVMLMRCRSDR